MTIADKIYGPITVTFNDLISGTQAYGPNKRNFAVLGQATVVTRTEFEEGSAADCEEGRRVLAVITVSDVVPADMDTVEGYQGDVEILVAKTGKVLTFPGTALQPNQVFANLVDGRVEFTVTNNWPIGTTHANVMTHATP